VPFLFALIRAVTTGGHDLRYFVLAAAALCGGAGVLLSARRSVRTAAAMFAAAFALSTAFAVGAGWVLGTTLGPGLLIVAAGFGFCVAVACAAQFRSTP
jgi:hypothetical protein